ncbi:hypothetical protein PsYK624_144890 [Phanerochaete sordida]|uniref:Uncharacterized protein n=1 Tax=Phanerochaete sordida TaxID=48140 RepID=A0A9P3LK81_9APHY|nr:hypothetical protein PsYK624_144890 [Phanerochaete sordida]
MPEPPPHVTVCTILAAKVKVLKSWIDEANFTADKVKRNERLTKQGTIDTLRTRLASYYGLDLTTAPPPQEGAAPPGGFTGEPEHAASQQVFETQWDYMTQLLDRWKLCDTEGRPFRLLKPEPINLHELHLEGFGPGLNLGLMQGQGAVPPSMLPAAPSGLTFGGGGDARSLRLSPMSMAAAAAYQPWLMQQQLPPAYPAYMNPYAAAAALMHTPWALPAAHASPSAHTGFISTPTPTPSTSTQSLPPTPASLTAPLPATTTTSSSLLLNSCSLKITALDHVKDLRHAIQLSKDGKVQDSRCKYGNPVKNRKTSNPSLWEIKRGKVNRLESVYDVYVEDFKADNSRFFGFFALSSAPRGGQRKRPRIDGDPAPCQGLNKVANARRRCYSAIAEEMKCESYLGSDGTFCVDKWRARWGDKNKWEV